MLKERKEAIEILFNLYKEVFGLYPKTENLILSFSNKDYRNDLSEIGLAIYKYIEHIASQENVSFINSEGNYDSDKIEQFLKEEDLKQN